MPLAIPNTTLADAYSDATTWAGNDALFKGYVVVANQACFIQLLVGRTGAREAMPEQFLPPGLFPIAPGGKLVTGLRARNAEVGVVAQFFGMIYYPEEPMIGAGSAMPYTVGANGSVVM